MDNPGNGTVDNGGDESFDKEKLLAEWRNDTNLVDTSADDEEFVDDPTGEKFNNIKIILSIPKTETEIRSASLR